MLAGVRDVLTVVIDLTTTVIELADDSRRDIGAIFEGADLRLEDKQGTPKRGGC